MKNKKSNCKPSFEDISKNYIAKDLNGAFWHVVYIRPVSPEIQTNDEGEITIVDKELRMQHVVAVSEEDAISTFKELMGDYLPIDKIEIIGAFRALCF